MSLIHPLERLCRKWRLFYHDLPFGVEFTPAEAKKIAKDRGIGPASCMAILKKNDIFEHTAHRKYRRLYPSTNTNTNNGQ